MHLKILVVLLNIKRKKREMRFLVIKVYLFMDSVLPLSLRQRKGEGVPNPWEIIHTKCERLGSTPGGRTIN
jgi:hypothetical protein